MAKINNPIIVSVDNFDELLGSTGYLLPSNELELLRFNKLYDDYVFKLTDTKIDLMSIMEGRYICKSAVTRIVQIDSNEINELKMVARNGEGQVPDDIISKMKAKHRKKNDDRQK